MRTNTATLPILAALLTTGAAAQTFAGFSPQTPIALPAAAGGVATGDLDNDGDTDACVTLRAFGGGGVAILLNDGAGSLTLAQIIPTVPTPRKPVLADFNNDGFVDIAFPDDNASNIVVIRSNGNGTFQFPTPHATIPNPVSIATADLNSDGFADIVSVSPSSNRVGVLLGNGTGFTASFFGSGLGTGLGYQPTAIAAADLNNDGDVDLVTANSGSNDLAIYYGLGSGGFFNGEFAYYVEQPGTPTALAIADMDNNGDPDIVVARALATTTVGWLRNDRDGGSETFPNFNEGEWHTPVGGRVIDLSTGPLDCEGDAFPDVLGANEGNGAIDTLLNAGAGALTRDAASPAGGVGVGVAMADFDGDGDTDAIACDAVGNVATVYLNQCIADACPADLTGDGMLNFFDVSTYITLYNMSNPAADFAAPFGTLNFFDVAEYIAQFNAGCP